MSIAADPRRTFLHGPVPIRAEDALFLHAQTPLLCQQVGAVLLLESAPVDAGKIRDAVRERVRGVPELQRRLEAAPGWWRRPRWVADGDIDFSECVREVALGEGRNQRALRGVVDSFFSRRCDPYRMPWEVLLIRGASDGRVAVALKVHHVIGDSYAIIGMLSKLFDTGADMGTVTMAAPEAPQTFDAIGWTRTAAHTIRGLWHLAAAGAAPDVSVCGPFTSDRRRYVPVALPARDVATTARVLGTSIADLLLAVSAEALGRLLRSRGEETTGRVLRIAVPRAWTAGYRAGGCAPGNRTAAISLDVPIGPADPAELLSAVRGQVALHVRQGEDAAAALVLRAMNFLPPPVQRLAATQLYQRRWFNMLVSVFPGVRRAHRLLGVRVEEVYPVLALADGVGLAIGAMTWDTSLSVGILADAGLVPDADKLAAEFTGAFEAYQAAAGRQAAAGQSARSLPGPQRGYPTDRRGGGHPRCPEQKLAAVHRQPQLRVVGMRPLVERAAGSLIRLAVTRLPQVRA
jgi:diacylglycerol O-acyltransferase / wax synthase